MKRLPFAAIVVLVFAVRAFALAAETNDADVFRKGNESASRGDFGAAVSQYAELEKTGVRSPSLYWNWAQVASAMGRRGETLWALMCAQRLLPQDSSAGREIERTRVELGLDRAEMSLGLLGDLDLLARRNYLDRAALAFASVSTLLLLPRNRSKKSSNICLAISLSLALPGLLGRMSDARAVVIEKDAPLFDRPRADGVTLSTLREGEVMPILGEEGEYLQVQDASGARGFAHRAVIRRIGPR